MVPVGKLRHKNMINILESGRELLNIYLQKRGYAFGPLDGQKQELSGRLVHVTRGKERQTRYFQVTGPSALVNNRQLELAVFGLVVA